MPFARLLSNAGLASLAPVIKVGFYLALGKELGPLLLAARPPGHRCADFYHRYVGVYYNFAAIVFGLIHLANHCNVGAWWYGKFKYCRN